MADDNSISEASSSDESVPILRTKIKKEPCQPKAMKFSIRLDNFGALKHEEVCSPKFVCFGYEWRLRFYPRGFDDYPEPPKGSFGVCLERTVATGNWPNHLKYSFEVKSPDGKASIQATNHGERYHSRLSSNICYLCSRSDIKHRFLDNKKTLTISVTMELDEFIPKNPLSATMLKLFGDAESSDVIFEITKKEDNPKKRKKASVPASPVRLYAHRFILEHTSSELAALCESSPEGGSTAPIVINDTKVDVFRQLLFYVYGGDVSQEYFVANAKHLIDAADKYGVVNLKLEAEVWYVHSTKLTVDNVIDNLLYAEAKNCALLKEAVMDYIVKNKKKVIKKVSLKDLPGDMYKDLLAAVSRLMDDSDEDDSDDEEEKKNDYASMGIGVLRQKLYAKGLDIDGSRDTLISALKNHA